jgi:hypothetical protein
VESRDFWDISWNAINSFCPSLMEDFMTEDPNTNQAANNSATHNMPNSPVPTTPIPSPVPTGTAAITIAIDGTMTGLPSPVSLPSPVTASPPQTPPSSAIPSLFGSGRATTL